MDFVFGALFGIIISYIAVRILIRMIVNKVERELGQSLDSLLKEVESPSQDIKEPIKARVEDINGVFYVFDTKNGDFIAQGKSVVEIQEHIKSRTLNQTIVIADGDPAVISKFRSTQP